MRIFVTEHQQPSAHIQQPTTEHRPISGALLTALLLSPHDPSELLHSKELTSALKTAQQVFRTFGTAGCHNLGSSPDGTAETSVRDERFLWPERTVSNNKSKGKAVREHCTKAYWGGGTAPYPPHSMFVVAVPLQAWSGPEGSRKLRFPGFMTTAQDGDKVVRITHTGRLYPQEMLLVLISVGG